MVLAACADPGRDPAAVATLVTATIQDTSIDVEARFVDDAEGRVYSFTDAVEARIAVGDRDVPLTRSANNSLVGHLDAPSPIAGDVSITATTSFGGESITLVGSTPAPFSIAAPADPSAAQPIVIKIGRAHV